MVIVYGNDLEPACFWMRILYGDLILSGNSYLKVMVLTFWGVRVKKPSKTVLPRSSVDVIGTSVPEAFIKVEPFGTYTLIQSL